MSKKPRTMKLPDGLEVQVLDIATLAPADYNPRQIDDDALAGLSESVQTFGLAELPVYNRRTGRLVGGHQRLKVLKSQGANTVGVIVGDWSPEDEKDLNVILNSPHVRGTFTPDVLSLLRDSKGRDEARFASLRLNKLLREHHVSGHARTAAAKSSKEVQKPKKPITKPGDVWGLGAHRITCGDSSLAKTWEAVLGGELGADGSVIATDPPYCSGGFQEAGKRQGSVGTRNAGEVRRDKLSTRGYQALMAAVLGQLSAVRLAYIFTDWRMWVSLYDVVERAGYGVRNMLVWDKDQPGMGRGWLHQHELIMLAAKGTPGFSNKGSVGNVIREKRTGNVHHVTEKPVPLMARLIKVAGFAERIIDPFLGSGTTLLAADQLAVPCRGVEDDPGYVDVVIQRWENLTGGKAKRL